VSGVPFWPAALLGATALHAGFQATVTLLVYPALVEVPDDRWATAHALHSRRITPLVGVVYVVLAVACAGALLDDPGSAASWVAGVGAAGAALATATVAAPTHGLLSAGRTPALARRLLVADRVRLGCALLALAGGLLAALG
jgi:formate-dependent nitrite reductase membrane component NrfD